MTKNISLYNSLLFLLSISVVCKEEPVPKQEGNSISKEGKGVGIYA